jgi:hypothetical protein
VLGRAAASARACARANGRGRGLVAASCAHGDSALCVAPLAIKVVGSGPRRGCRKGAVAGLREPLTVLGEVDAEAREGCWELGAVVAASLMEG